ncbi:MAG TPA: hypothetical protein VFV46_00145 [Lacibacter sp.]|nr:hypothetical protein [Lacibacter sp.]
MMNKFATFLFFAFALSACSKEKSLDRSGGDPNAVFLGNNCKISQILNVDSNTNVAWEAHNIFFNSSGLPVRSEVYDSVGLAPYADDVYTYKGDTIFVNGNNGFFVRNSSGRVVLYRTPEDPTDPLSEDLDITFTYNSAGYVTNVSYAYTALPSVKLLQSVYTYTGSNLTNARLEVVNPTPELLVEASLSYSTQTVRDFIYTFPDAYYYVNHLPALNFGNKPGNAVSKVTTRYYTNGALADSIVTNYSRYKLSGDGYVLQFYADGDWQDGMGLYYEFTKFKYLCK